MKLTIIKNSENAWITFGKIDDMLKREYGYTCEQCQEYINSLMKLTYDEWTKKVANDFPDSVILRNGKTK